MECETYADLESNALEAAALPDIEHEFPPPPFASASYPREQFKGLYRCDVGTGCPTYSAAFIASKDQLLSRPVG